MPHNQQQQQYTLIRRLAETVPPPDSRQCSSYCLSDAQYLITFALIHVCCQRVDFS